MFTVLAAGVPPSDLALVRSGFQEQCQLHRCRSFSAVLDAYRRYRFDFALLSLGVLRQAQEAAAGAAGGEGFDTAFGRIRELAPAAEVIAVCGETEVEDAVAAVQAGARSYLTLPLREEALQFAVDSLLESVRRESELEFLRLQSVRLDAPDPERTESPAMAEVLRKARMVAPTRSNVLLTGETGTGKGVLARFIHLHSNRKAGPFLSLHCGAIPESLVESELFGHERGAFTGAHRRSPGKFEAASGGTIFLDEIATVSPAVQVKLLQVIQERQVQRLGSDRPVPVDVRIIAATNADLRAEAAAGRFRPDLYYRLSVFPIETVPLRERREDIPHLVEQLLRRLRTHHGKDVRAVAPEVVEALCRYPWPGNIRELENVVERAFILEPGAVLGPDGFPPEFQLGGPPLRPEDPAAATDLPLAEFRRRCVERAERTYLEHLLTRHRGRIDATARAAGVGVRQLHKLMTRHGLSKTDYKDPAAPRPATDPPTDRRG